MGNDFSGRKPQRREQQPDRIEMITQNIRTAQSGTPDHLPAPLSSLFIVRMSAIGDTILSSRTHRLAREKGYAPVLVTGAANASLVHCMPHLAGACLFSDAGLSFLLRPEGSASFSEVGKNEFLKNLKIPRDGAAGGSLPVADLQATGRSKRAFAEIDKLLKSQNIRTKKYVVNKLSFWRIVLVLWSFLAFKQWQGRTPPQWLRKKLKPVRELQRELFDSIPALEENAVHLPANGVIVPTKNSSAETGETGNEKHYVVLQLGSSFRLKSWPREHFRKLTDLLLANTAVKIVLSGGNDDRPVGAYLRFQNPERIADLTGTTTLQETLALIGGASYVVTGDSFAGHAADLMGVPASVLFGATHPLLGFEPEGNHTFVHHAALSCSPCSRHGQGECRFRNIRCMTSIKPEEVFTKIEQILSAQRQKQDATPTQI
jgi:heptosyltransferase-2